MLLTPSVSLQNLYIFADYFRVLQQTKLRKGYCCLLLGGCNIKVGLLLEGLISQGAQNWNTLILLVCKWIDGKVGERITRVLK